MTPRQQALINGHKFYYSGQPCKHGHTGPRYTNGGACLECLGRSLEDSQEASPRQQALINGHKFYYSDQPCKHDHTGPRYTKSGACLECLGQSADAAHQDTARQQAVANGDTYYTTGKPCKHGHTGPRYTSTSNCVECAREVKHQRQHIKQQRQQAARQQAADNYERYYNSGQRCAAGHKGKRLVATDECIECIAPDMTHDQLARYNLIRHSTNATALDVQNAQQQLDMCQPGEYRYWVKLLALLKRKIKG